MRYKRVDCRVVVQRCYDTPHVISLAASLVEQRMRADQVEQELRIATQPDGKRGDKADQNLRECDGYAPIGGSNEILKRVPGRAVHLIPPVLVSQSIKNCPGLVLPISKCE
jgi:hypothetical protein